MNFSSLLFSVNFLSQERGDVRRLKKKSAHCWSQGRGIRNQKASEEPKSVNTTEGHLLLRSPCIHDDKAMNTKASKSIAFQKKTETMPPH